MTPKGSDKKRDVLPEDAVHDPAIKAVVDKYLAAPKRRLPRASSKNRIYAGTKPVPLPPAIPAQAAMGTTELTVGSNTTSHVKCRQCPLESVDRGLCATHLAEARANKRNGGTATHRVTEAERVEIRRRLAKFETPKDIAKALGVNINQIHYAAKGK